MQQWPHDAGIHAASSDARIFLLGGRPHGGQDGFWSPLCCISIPAGAHVLQCAKFTWLKQTPPCQLSAKIHCCINVGVRASLIASLSPDVQKSVLKSHLVLWAGCCSCAASDPRRETRRHDGRTGVWRTAVNSKLSSRYVRSAEAVITRLPQLTCQIQALNAAHFCTHVPSCHNRVSHTRALLAC